MAWTRKGKFIEAVKNGKVDDVKDMLAAEPTLASINSTSESGPLAVAVRNVDLPMVQVFFEAGIQKKEWFNLLTVLAESYEASKPEDVYNLAAYLIEKGYKANEESFNYATQNKKHHLIPLLLSNAEDAEEVPEEIIYRLILDSAPSDVILRAIESVNNVNNTYEDDTCLHLAVEKSRRDIIEALLKKGAQIDASGIIRRGYSGKESPLHCSVRNGNSEITALLLLHGARVDTVDGYGNSPIAIAKDKNASSAIALMLEEAESRLAKKFTQSNPHESGAAGLSSRDEFWRICGADQVAYIGEFRHINRKITELFNFASRERVMIVENIAEKKETVSAPQSFSTIEQTRLKQAFDAFRAQGGIADEAYVFGSRRANVGLTIVDDKKTATVSAHPVSVPAQEALG
jgi:ankyrin repeat protein